MREDKPITTLRTTITNQDGVVVLDGTAVVWRDPAVERGGIERGRPREGRVPSVLATSNGAGTAGATHRRNTMTVTTENQHLNGVDVATLFATLDAVKGTDEIAEVPVPRHATRG